MANDRLKFAIGRLERAAARVERILVDSPLTKQNASDAKLAQRHQQLRDQVQSAIGRIDSLITSAVR